MITFGTAIRRLRYFRQLTIEDAALEIGCSYSTLHAIENNQHEPKARTMVKIADVYGVKLDELAGYLRGNNESD